MQLHLRMEMKLVIQLVLALMFPHPQMELISPMILQTIADTDTQICGQGLLCRVKKVAVTVKYNQHQKAMYLKNRLLA
jgi:hypothetical protein